MELKPNTYYRIVGNEKAMFIGHNSRKLPVFEIGSRYATLVDSDVLVEWKEPQRKTAWVGMLEDGSETEMYISREVLLLAYTNLLGIRRVELVEGEFDE